MNKLLSVLFAFLLIVPSMVNGGSQDIKKKQRALEQLRKEIDEYETRIRESEKKEKATLERLDDYEKQSNLVRSLLSGLVDEEEQLQASIALASDNITFLEKQISFLKLHYAKYVTAVYKFGRVYDLETLLSSNSINQLYIRIEYLKRFSEQRQRDLQKIQEKRQILETEKADLEQKLDEQRDVISSKEKEKEFLDYKKKKRAQVLRAIRKDKATMKKALVRKNHAAEELEGLITDLVEKERIRKEHEAELARERSAERERLKLKPVEEPPTEPGIPFQSLKGKLPWPVATGAVVAHFGNQVHPVLKTITQNTGIDIAIKSGSTVKSVADGEVAMIHWLPSYGNLVILRHPGGFHTVYAHLSEISVAEGQTVSKGTVIGKSGESIGGSLLHFEVWKEKEKQNPESWLSRRGE
ncbi:MAG TPA: peptidoglycan DD-metalloendopeptidase family protein [Bacteroidota bacterium]|nr:peptidoglycan DD-metalloendopeptidase family protein [Bacteroidota bacterium]